jgi:hypothetical protein
MLHASDVLFLPVQFVFAVEYQQGFQEGKDVKVFSLLPPNSPCFAECVAQTGQQLNADFIKRPDSNHFRQRREDCVANRRGHEERKLQVSSRQPAESVRSKAA